MSGRKEVARGYITRLTEKGVTIKQAINRQGGGVKERGVISQLPASPIPIASPPKYKLSFSSLIKGLRRTKKGKHTIKIQANDVRMSASQINKWSSQICSSQICYVIHSLDVIERFIRR